MFLAEASVVDSLPRGVQVAAAVVNQVLVPLLVAVGTVYAAIAAAHGKVNGDKLAAVKESVDGAATVLAAQATADKSTILEQAKTIASQEANGHS